MKSDKFSPAGCPAISRIVSPPRNPALAPGLSLRTDRIWGVGVPMRHRPSGKLGISTGGEDVPGVGSRTKRRFSGVESSRVRRKSIGLVQMVW